MSVIHTPSTAARAVSDAMSESVPESYIIHCERLGVIKPQRTPNGRRLLTEEDVGKVIAYRSRKALKPAA